MSLNVLYLFRNGLFTCPFNFKWYNIVLSIVTYQSLMIIIITITITIVFIYFCSFFHKYFSSWLDQKLSFIFVIIEISQKDLETLIPKTTGSYICVVDGKYKGKVCVASWHHENIYLKFHILKMFSLFKENAKHH